MTDIRARLTDFLYDSGVPPDDVSARVDDLLSLPGIAVVALPPSDDSPDAIQRPGVIGRWFIGEYGAAIFTFDDGYTHDTSGTDLGTPTLMREHAAALLAAANAAEAVTR